MFQHLPHKKDKQPKHLTVAYQDYLYTDMQQSDSIFGDIPPELTIELQSNIHDMRHEFKRTTKRIKRLYADKEPTQSVYVAAKLERLRLAKNGGAA